MEDVPIDDIESRGVEETNSTDPEVRSTADRARDIEIEKKNLLCCVVVLTIIYILGSITAIVVVWLHFKGLL